MTRHDMLIRTLEDKGLELERLNRELAEREARLRAIFDAEPECVKLLAADGSLLEINPAGLRMLEADSFPQVAGRCIYPMVVEEHRAAFRDLTESVFRGETGTLEFQMTGLKGGRRWLETHATPLRDATGVITALVGITRDITASKHAEAALRDSEANFRALFEQAAVGVAQIDTVTGRFAQVNRRYCEIVGYTAEEMRRLTFQEITHPEDLQPDLDNMARLHRGDIHDFSMEKRYFRKDGTIVWVALTVSAPWNFGGSPTFHTAVVEDITERKRAEEELRQSEAKFRLLAEESLAGVVIIQDGRFKYVNPALAGIMGYSREELLAAPGILDLVAEADRPLVRENLRRRLEGEVQHLRFAFHARRKDGSLVDLDVFGSPMMFEGRTAVMSTVLDITARRGAEEAARRAHRQRGDVIASVDGIVWEADADTFHFTFVSPRAERLLGYPTSRWIDEPSFWAEHIHPDDREEAVRYCGQCTLEQRDHEFEYRMLAADGRVVWLRDIVTVVVENGGPTKLRGIMVDVTKPKQAEAAMASRAAQQAVVAELGHLALSGVGLPQLFDQSVSRVAETFGVEYCKVLELLPDANAFRLVAGVGWTPGLVGQALVGAGSESQAGFTLASKSPVIVDDLRTESRFSGPPLLTDHGVVSGISVIIGETERPLGVLGAHTTRRRAFTTDDVNFIQSAANILAEAIERKRAAESLRQSEERFRELAETIDDVFWMSDPASHRMLYVSPGYEKTWGRSCQSLYDRPEAWLDTIHPLDQDRVHDAVSTRLAGGTYDEEYRVVRPDGEVRWVRDRAFLVRNAAGQVERVVGIARDIHARKAAEEELQRREERFRSLIEYAADLIGVIDHQGVIRFLSPSIETILGYPKDLLIGRSSLEFIHPDDVPHTTAALREAVANAATAVKVEYRVRHRDGQWRTMQTIGRSIPDQAADGFIVLNSRDITESRQLEEQLRQSQKMEAIGQLAGGIAHDFNNLLTVINGTADLALTNLSAGDPLRADLLQIRDAGDRAASLTRQLLAFGRKQIMVPDILDLNAVVSNMQRMLQRLIGEHIEFVVKSSETLASVRADRSQIEQVVVNLVVNARDAMRHGGVLTIEAQNVVIDAAFAEQHPSVEPGPHVMLAVTDTGVGMDTPTAKRVFEPFFTTKGPAQNTGLGLATVYGIVKQSGGTIWVDSEPGRGTTFTIYLPQVARDTRADRSDRSAMAAPGAETILIVEDEAAVRNLATRFLQSAGYTVVTASNGAEALSLLERHDQPVHLMLTDVVMPGMSGCELATRLESLRPGMKVIYTSGYTDDTVLRHGVFDNAAEFIGKPYSKAELTRKVRDVLDAFDA